MATVEIGEGLEIPEAELSFTTGPSSGPGGQNVNRTHTRATLSFDVAASPSLSDEQRRRIVERLGSRLTKGGMLRVTSQRHRSQAANRKAALVRFTELLAEAQAEDPERRPTRVPKAVRRRRLESKRHRARVKRERHSPPPSGD
jgi:ribosome-associated protein